MTNLFTRPAPAPAKWASVMERTVKRGGKRVLTFAWGFCDAVALAWACEQEVASVEAAKRRENAQAQRDLARSLGLDPWKGKRPGGR